MIHVHSFIVILDHICQNLGVWPPPPGSHMQGYPYCFVINRYLTIYKITMNESHQLISVLKTIMILLT